MRPASGRILAHGIAGHRSVEIDRAISRVERAGSLAAHLVDEFAGGVEVLVLLDKRFGFHEQHVGVAYQYAVERRCAPRHDAGLYVGRLGSGIRFLA